MSTNEHDMDQPHVRHANAAHDGEDSGGAVDPGMRRMFGMLGVRTPERAKGRRGTPAAAARAEELARVGALMPGRAADPLAAPRGRGNASAVSDPLAAPRVALAEPEDGEEGDEPAEEDEGEDGEPEGDEEEPEAARTSTLAALDAERRKVQRSHMLTMQRLHARRRELVTRSRSTLAARPGRVAHRTR